MTTDDRQEHGPEKPAEQPALEGERGPQAPATEETLRLEEGGGGAGEGGGGGPAGGGGGPAGGGGPTGPAPGPRRLLRSRDDRVIGGVCGGLGRYFNVDPLLFRIGVIALAFVGGAGVLLYLAALLLVPSEPEAGHVSTTPGEGRNRALLIAAVVIGLLVAWPFLLGGGLIVAGLLVPVAVLVAAGVLAWWAVSGQGPSGEPADIARRAALGVGVLILCLAVAFFGAWAAAGGPDGLVAGLVIAAGVAILAGAFLRPVRWLILPAVILALSAGSVSAAGIDTSGGTGDREYRPGSTADLRERYELGLGELEVDLRNTSLPPGDVPLRLDLGVGEARVLVPEDVCVATTAEIGMGQADVFERGNGGIDVDLQDGLDAPPDTTRLVLDADIGVGHLVVSHHDVDHGGFDRGDYYGNDALRAGNDACLDTGKRVSD
jgi:phage shock protein PspC (stress-responsive transcriptional regulator)